MSCKIENKPFWREFFSCKQTKTLFAHFQSHTHNQYKIFLKRGCVIHAQICKSFRIFRDAAINRAEEQLPAPLQLVYITSINKNVRIPPRQYYFRVFRLLFR